jgi:hypothetical protein
VMRGMLTSSLLFTRRTPSLTSAKKTLVAKRAIPLEVPARQVPQRFDAVGCQLWHRVDTQPHADRPHAIRHVVREREVMRRHVEDEVAKAHLVFVHMPGELE